jgi:hypothetical protein
MRRLLTAAGAPRVSAKKPRNGSTLEVFLPYYEKTLHQIQKSVKMIMQSLY